MAAIAIHVPNGFKNLFLCEDIAGIGSKEYKGYSGSVVKTKI